MMLRRLRVAVLLYVLLFVAAGHYLTRARSTDWDQTLWVGVYPVNGDGRALTGAFVGNLRREDFEPLERFFAREARRFGLPLERPFRIEVAAPRALEVPALSASPSLLEAVVFGLKLRWLALRLGWSDDLPTVDIAVLAVFHDGEATATLDRSAGLQKGLVAMAHLFAAQSASGSNHVVLAHELLHTLGATDKYEAGTHRPRFPDGYGDPDAVPLHPQQRAELMGGRIAITEQRAEIPRGLEQVVIGTSTGREIGWLDP